MLEYELCKRLKEAGFPQTAFVRVCTHNRTLSFNSFLCNCPSEEKAVSPTLSELIEACALKEFKLEYAEYDNWYACNTYADDWESTTRLRVEGDTAEEAVANLYLQLHS